MKAIRKLSLFVSVMLCFQVLTSVIIPFQTADAAIAGPVVLSYSPANNTSNVGLSSPLIITFDENVVKGASTAAVSIYKTATNELVEKITVNVSRVRVVDNVVTITPSSSSLQYDTSYYVLIDTGAFLNASNQAPFAGIQSAIQWSFTTVPGPSPDNTKPELTYVYPANGSNNVPIDSSFTLNFSENVFAASGSISITSPSDSRSISVTSSELTGSGSTSIVIKPNKLLRPLTTYTMTISTSNFQDGSGNILNTRNPVPLSWTFTTAAGPVNLATGSPLTPAHMSNNHQPSANLTIAFDQAVQRNSGKYIEIRKVSDNSLVERIQATSSSVSLNAANNIATINPSRDLVANTSYYVLIDTGAFSQLGNSNAVYYGMQAATEWVFTVGNNNNDRTNPTISTYSPTRGNSKVELKDKLVITFNEVVFPYAGTIEIRESSTGVLYRSIPVTSERVSGGGTKEITIDPHRNLTGEAAKTFTKNKKYYVTITGNAFQDASGNFYAGINSNTFWTFTVTQEAVLPQLVSLSPSNNSTIVSTNQQFKATFDKPVYYAGGEITFKYAGSGSGVSDVTATNIKSDPDNNKIILFEPNGSLQSNTDYYVSIAEDAIADNNNNYFIGILNQYQWKFKTIGGDRTAPAINKTEVSGSTVRLIYNELLNEDLKPSPASFYVTVAGVARSIKSVEIKGNVVELALTGTLSTSQKVMVAYTKPDVGLIQDLSGNQAQGFAAREATNGASSIIPKVNTVSASGSQITLRFSENLNTVNKLAYTQFTVTSDGISMTVNSVTHSTNTVTLQLNYAMTNGKNVVVSYSPSLYPLIGVSSNQVPGFTYNLTAGSSINPGTTSGSVNGAPVLQSITSSGNTLTLQYNETLKSNSTPGKSQYSVIVDGSTKSISRVNISGSTVILTLSTSLSSSSQIKVSYTATNYTVLDSEGKAASSFSNVLANSSLSTGNGDGTAVKLQGAILKGERLTLNFSGKLNESSIPDSSQFLLRLNNSVRTISDVEIDGQQVILELTAPANTGDSATISYFGTSGMLQSESYVDVAAFSNVTVANQTTILDTLTDDYSEATGGVLLKTSTATTSSVTTPGGSNATRYRINNDKLITAVSALVNAGLKNPRIVFEVPDGQSAAVVAYNIVALEMVKKLGAVTLVVKHQDSTYEIPLETIDLNVAGRMANGSNTLNDLQITMEQGSTTKTNALTTAISRSGSTLVEGPYYYDVSVVNGSSSQQLNDFKGMIKRTVNTTASINRGRTTAVLYDEQAGTITHVPTSFQTVNGATAITFQRAGNSAYAIVRSDKTFSDMTGHWGESAVLTMARKFVVEGHSTTHFAPSKSITRGEFATYIAKGLGLSADKSAASKFTDVNSNTVMGGYIGAAAKAGIVAGVTSTKFNPNSYITRQDMAIMMIRAASYAGLNTKLTSTADQYLNGYSDRGSVSSYAKTAMAESIQAGIISGTTSTTLSPKKNATRVEGTIMIMRLLEKVGYLQQQ